MSIKRLLPVTTGIGSVPHTDIEAALDMVTTSVDVPFWTQHPKLSPFESMIPQFTEFLPYTVVEDNGRRIFCVRPETDSYAALERFYEDALSDEHIERIGTMSEFCAAGLHTFLRHLEKEKKRYACLKLQTTGPFTFTLGLNFDDKTPIYSDAQMREAALLLLKAKSLWQVRIFEPFSDELILFLDEPILSAIGTYIQLTPEVVTETLKNFTDGIKEEAPKLTVGVHCCGNTDWSLLAEAGVDIISFDAYFYGETLLLYADRLSEFVSSGGILAFGIVPTDGEHTLKETPEALEARLTALLQRLSDKGVDVPKEQMLLTPSCGVGSLTTDAAEAAFSLLRSIRIG